MADNTVRLRLVQPARRGHGELLCSADEKVTRGWVAAALRAAIAEFGFLSAHFGSAQGCGKGQATREVGDTSRERTQAKGTRRGGNRVGSEESRMHRKKPSGKMSEEEAGTRRGFGKRHGITLVRQPRISFPGDLETLKPTQICLGEAAPATNGRRADQPLRCACAWT